jgi:membrane protein
MKGQSVKAYLKKLWIVFRDTSIQWNASGPWRQSAILSYYTIFSLPALLLIVIVVTGSLFGEEAVSNELSEQIAGTIGEDAALAVEAMVVNAAETGSTTLNMIIGVGLLLFGATSIFYHLQLSLNRIWGVVPQPKKAFLKYIRDRLLSFGLVLIIGFLMLISLILTSLLATLGDWLTAYWPGLMLHFVKLANHLISLLVSTILFAMMFKLLPDAVIRWRSVSVGALITALLFALGQFGLSIYFSRTDPGSVYGAASSVILIMVWISYVALILLYGAEFTRQWANHFGHGIRPKGSAMLLESGVNKFMGFSE